MIRKFKSSDLERIMEIWITTNIKAHDFIDKDYWLSNFEMVKAMIPEAEVFVFEENNIVEGFIGITNNCIAGLFVAEKMQSKGIGSMLLNKCIKIYGKLSLNVYEKNQRAVKFYIKNKFEVEKKDKDINTNEIEYCMTYE